MSLEQRAHPLEATPVDASCPSSVPERRLHVGDPIPITCDAHDLARIFNKSIDTIYGWHKRGMLRRFELRRPFGTQRWSGVLLARYVAESRLTVVQGRRHAR